MALGLTQPLTEISTRNISWGWRRPVRRADNLTTFMCRLSWNLEASTSWKPQDLPRPVMGLLYLYICLISIDDPSKPPSKRLFADGFDMRHISTHDLCSHSEQMGPSTVHSTENFVTVLVSWCNGGQLLKSGIRSLLKCVLHSEIGPTCTQNTEFYQLGLSLHLQCYLIRNFLCLNNLKYNCYFPKSQITTLLEYVK